MNKYVSLVLGASLIVAGSILIGTGAICIALKGMTGAYPLLIISGVISFVAGFVYFFQAAKPVA
jgi:general stress protein CsbA